MVTQGRLPTLRGSLSAAVAASTLTEAVEYRNGEKQLKLLMAAVGRFRQSLETVKKKTLESRVTVPRTDTGAPSLEGSGVSRKTLLREVGKLAPKLRYKGCLPCEG